MIQMEHICKSYGSHIVLQDFNLIIKDKEFVVITGESGCGKTTLMNLLGFLDTYDKGTYRFMDNQNIKPYSQKAFHLLREKIGYLFQDFALLENETVQYNLSIALEHIKGIHKKEEMIKALKQVGLDEIYLKKKICECSGGEQQRIAIARLLLKPCELILADEPTGSLDYENKMVVYELLRLLQSQGKTIVIVSHDQELIDKADRVVRIEKNAATK